MNKQQPQNRLPIAQITLHYNESAYEKVEGEIKRIAHQYVERQRTYDVVEVLRDGTFELSDGRIVCDLAENHFILSYGCLEVKGEQVSVYSTNGHFLRYVSKGQKFRVYDMKVDAISQITRYYIGKSREVITSKADVIFVKGYYVPAHQYSAPNESALVLEENVEQVVTAIEDNKIQLASFPNLWWDLSIYKGTLKGFAF